GFANAPVPISKGQDTCLEGRRTRESRGIKDFLLVEGLARQQGPNQRVELLSMRVEEPLGLVVAFADDLAHLGVDGFSGSLAERLCTGVTVRAAQVRVLPRRELHQSDALAHAPARDHVARDTGGLLNIAFR